MRRKFLFLFIIIVIAAALFSWGTRKDSKIAESKAETQAADSKLDINVPLSDGSEIISRNFLATSSEEVSNFHCAGDFLGGFLTARAVLVRYLNGEGSFLELNKGIRWPTASLAKLMTSLVALENIKGDKEIKITNGIILENTPLKFGEGEIYTMADLMKAMLAVSSNSAGEAIADDFGKAQFIELMNRKAASLGMNETSFYDASGISASDQSTTDDLFKLLSYIYNARPEILQYARAQKSVITELNSRRKIVLNNANQFVGEPDYLGGKTGTTDAAGQNLISLFSFHKQPLAVIILGSQNRFEEARQLLNCVE